MNGSLDVGNVNRFVDQNLGAAGHMKGIVFDRSRTRPVQDEFDGQMAIAALESPGVEITYQTTFRTDSEGNNSTQTDGSEIWKPFSTDGRLSNSNLSWVSGG